MSQIQRPRSEGRKDRVYLERRPTVRRRGQCRVAAGKFPRLFPRCPSGWGRHRCAQSVLGTNAASFGRHWLRRGRGVSHYMLLEHVQRALDGGLLFARRTRMTKEGSVAAALGLTDSRISCRCPVFLFSSAFQINNTPLVIIIYVPDEKGVSLVRAVVCILYALYELLTLY